MSEQPFEPMTDPAASSGSDSSGGPGKDARLFGMLCHLLALCGFVGVPLGHILGPLVIWLLKKDVDPFVDEQGKESLNFQITMTIAAIVLGVVTCIVAGIGALVVVIFDIVMVIIATTKANKGIHYRYPLTLRLIK